MMDIVDDDGPFMLVSPIKQKKSAQMDLIKLPPSMHMKLKFGLCSKRFIYKTKIH